MAAHVQEVTGEAVEVACVDQGYTGEQAAQKAQARPIRLEVIKLPEANKGFVRLPRRWEVERSNAWAARLRRLARDPEHLGPGNHDSAGKRQSGKTRKGNHTIHSLLCEAANVAVHTHSALRDKYQSLVPRKGHKKAHYRGPHSDSHDLHAVHPSSSVSDSWD